MRGAVLGGGILKHPGKGRAIVDVLRGVIRRDDNADVVVDDDYLMGKAAAGKG